MLVIEEMIKIAKQNKDKNSVLRSIRFDLDNQYIGVTDRHRAIINHMTVDSDNIISIDSGFQLKDQHYPNLLRILGDTTASVECKLLNKKYKEFRSLSVVKLSSQNDVLAINDVAIGICKKDFAIYLNGKYLYEALYFLDRLYKHKSDEFMFNLLFKSPLEPLVFSKSTFDYVITPIRNY